MQSLVDGVEYFDPFEGNDPAALALAIGLFDREFYVDQNMGAVDHWPDPLDHFLRFGMDAQRSPSPYFDPQEYVVLYPDLRHIGINPVRHYLEYGSREGRAPHPLFDPKWYLEHYPDVAAAGFDPFVHFALHGAAEGRDPGPRFSSNWYSGANPDVLASGLPPFKHYLLHGRQRGGDVVRPYAKAAKAKFSHGWLNVGGIDGSLFGRASDAQDLPPPQAILDVDMLETLEDARLVSFDIWSTVLHRDCHPDEIKLRSARFLLLAAGDDLLPGMRERMALYRARLRAENDSAPHGDFEYDFEVAAKYWLDMVLTPQCGQERRTELAKQLIEHELWAESRSVSLDPNAHRAIASLSSPPIFISDFYMSSAFIERLLDQFGLNGLFLRGYSSCENFQNKRSGKLFERVLADFAAEPKDMLHIGDNPVADDEQPAALGIRTAPYLASGEGDRLRWFADAFEALQKGDLSLHERRIIALAIERSGEVPAEYVGEAADAYRAGCVIGLLGFSYCLSILEDAMARQAQDIVFFTREGILFKELYEAVAQENPYGVTLPAARLLAVSRRATFAASLQSLNNAELMRFWWMYRRQSPAAFVKSLGLDPVIGEEAAGRAGVAFHEAVDEPWSDEGFQAFLADPEFKQSAEDAIATQRDVLRAYIDQELGDRDDYFVSDIGWRGSIQDNLARVLRKPIHGHYLALFEYNNPQSPGSTKAAWLGNDNEIAGLSLIDQVAPLEMIFNAPGGSTTGYARNDGGAIEPVKDLFPAEEAVIEAMAPCRSGMMAVIPALARYTALHGLMANDFRGIAGKVAFDLISEPPTVIADLFGRLEHNETFGAGTVEAMQMATAFDAAGQAEPGPNMHAGFSRWLASSRWPSAMVRQTHVREWWNGATTKQHASAPALMASALAPGIVKAVGSRLAIFAPGPLRASGGHRTIFNMVRALANAGFKPEIYSESEGEGLHLIQEYLGDVAAPIHLGWAQRRPADVAFATIAHSARYVRQNVSANCRAYLVQDAEALFNPIGDHYVLAENSYAQGLHHFTIGNWLTHVINNRYGSPAYPAGLGVDTSIYKLVPDIRRAPAICMLYQPEKPRRGNRMALDALSLLKRRRPEVEIFIYGSEHAPGVDFDAIHLGVIDDLTELNALYNRCAAGLCLSLSNPSRIPFEMMAAGCLPVDLYRYNNLLDHGDGLSLLTYQSAESIAFGLEQALDDPEALELRSKRLAASSASRTLNWECDAILANLLGILDGQGCESWHVAPSYKAKPLISPDDDNVAVREFCRWEWMTANARHDS